MKASSSMVRTFKGRTVVLTGASSGIGRALSLRLELAGATVHALDLDEVGLSTLVEEASGTGHIYPAILDVRDRTAYSAVIDEVLRISGSIDFLFNNAGVTQLGEAQNVPFERWKWVLDINLMGVINGINLVYPIMIAQGGGHIVNTASVAGATGYATAAAYTASKAAVLELTRSLGAEAKAYGVKLAVACPGYVDSGIFKQDRIIGADCDAMKRDLPVSMLSPDEAAEGFLRGVIRGKKKIIFPLTSQILWTISCWAPRLLSPFQSRFLRVFRKLDS